MNLRKFAKQTAVGRILVIPYRFFGTALPHCLRQFRIILRWTFTSKEHYNFTYDLTPLNRSYLASYISVVSGHPVEAIEGFMRELEADNSLRETLKEKAASSPDRHNSDVEPRYGRRLGWYALVRATKPRVIVETGVDRGLGTAVIAAALLRNIAEDCPGKLYATDIVPECGHLLSEPYKRHCEILIGDSVGTLKQFDILVDIFLHDSDHRPEYEWAEFLAVERRLHADSIVMSDNSAATSKLREFAVRIGRDFLYFQDQPANHWWPGDGIGTAFRNGHCTLFQPQTSPRVGSTSA